MTRIPVWRAASLPIFLLLGIALPLYFLSWVERYLYYLRPAELLPTYATAWLLLAVATIPIWLCAALFLKLVAKLGSAWGIRTLEIALEGVGVAIAFVALFSSTLAWLRTFGLAWNPSLGFRVVMLALGLGIVTALTPPGRVLAERLRAIALWGTAVGALSLLSIPFFGWTDAGSPTPSSATSARGMSRRPHIILLTIDALSAEHMSLYGAVHPDTPMLSAFAANATTFDHAYANGNFTTAGTASILTGTRPWTHRAVQLLSWPEGQARSQSLPALLKSHGYQTAYVSTNPLAAPARNGMAAYFDSAFPDRVREIFPCNESLSRVLRFTCPASELPLFGQLQKLIDLVQKPADNYQFDPRLATGPGLEWLRHTDPDKPVFLWIHLFPPHAPYAAPAPWLGHFDSSNTARSQKDSDEMQEYLLKLESPERVRTLAARYEESIEYVDHYVGDFLHSATQLLGNNTAIIVTADHGESFSHDYGAHCGPALYDEIIHIPLILKFPGQQQAARRSEPVEQVDIAATLAELAGIEPPAAWEGRSLVSGAASSGEPALAADKPVFSMNFEENPRMNRLTTGSVAVVVGHWKLVRYFGSLSYPLMPPLRNALYDLSSDPGERVDRADANPEVTRRLSALIATELARHGGPTD